MPGAQVEEAEELKLKHLLLSQEVVVGAMVVASAEKMVILPGNAPQEVVEEAITNVGIASKRATWPMTALSLRSVGDAERRVTRWRTAQCHRNALIVEKKVTPLPTVQNLLSVEGARRKATW